MTLAFSWIVLVVIGSTPSCVSTAGWLVRPPMAMALVSDKTATIDGSRLERGSLLIPRRAQSEGFLLGGLKRSRPLLYRGRDGAGSSAGDRIYWLLVS